MTQGSKDGKNAIKQADEALLASLGYKQEFKRAFTPLELLLIYAIPNGGGPAMVWGECLWRNLPPPLQHREA
ncbi:hypothetical protein MPER_14049, partial [Moniliophthora perniciosa FA553]